MLKGLLSAFSKKRVDNASTQQERCIVDIYGRPVEDALEYFYPKQIKGIPVFSVDSIYNHYYDSKIRDIIENCGIGDHREHHGKQVRELLYTEVIKRYIEYVHMIPASEDQHHSTPGGMIVHSLEASRWAQKWAKSKTPPSTGMHDLDRRSRPAYKYAAWLATLMHDAGKVLRDIIIDAVDIEVEGENKRVSRENPVPTWRPQKESLVDWAKRFHVATYSVTYIEREHNRHNIDSIQLLNPVLGNEYALNYLLDSPADVHGSLVRLLSGHDNRLDYITSAKQYGDQMSSARNMGISDSSTYLVDKKTSTHGRIIRAMRIARTTWDFNITGAHAWIIGGEVYLRYQKAFHSIINTAKKHDLNIPGAVETVLNIMEDNHIIQAHSDEYKSILFTPGTFTKEELLEIITGQRNAIWEEVIRVKWKGYVFNDDPAPDSMSGVYTIPSHDKFYQIDERGIVHELNRDELIALSAPVNDSADGYTYTDDDFAPATTLAHPSQSIGDEHVPTPPAVLSPNTDADASTPAPSPVKQAEKPETDKKALSPQDKKASPKQEAIKKAIEEAKKNKKQKPKMDFKNVPTKASTSETDTKQTEQQDGGESSTVRAEKPIQKENSSVLDSNETSQATVPGEMKTPSSKGTEKGAAEKASKAGKKGKRKPAAKPKVSVKDTTAPANDKPVKGGGEENTSQPNEADTSVEVEDTSSTGNNTISTAEDVPLPVINLDRIKRHKIPRHSATFVCIDDVMAENKIETRVEAIDLMRRQGLTGENKGSALVVAYRINGKLSQMVGLNDSQASTQKKGELSTTSTSTHPAKGKASSSKDTKAKPPAKVKTVSGKDKGVHLTQRPESAVKANEEKIEWESVFASDSASIHGLLIKIKNAPSGTLGAYLRGLSESLKDGASLSTVAVEHKGKAAIKTIPFLNYVNTQRSTPIRYRHIMKAVRESGETADSGKVGKESIFVINGQSVNQIQIEA